MGEGGIRSGNSANPAVSLGSADEPSLSTLPCSEIETYHITTTTHTYLLSNLVIYPVQHSESLVYIGRIL